MVKNLTGDRCQCPTCKEYFNSTKAFDKHRVGKHGVNRHCMSVNAMYDSGMAINQAGFWVTKLRDNAEQSRLRELRE